MKTHLITSRADWLDLADAVVNADTYPLTVAIYRGRAKKRSLDQNALAWAWYAEIAQWRGDMTAEEVHRECKLIFGIPILRAEDDDFRERYDAMLKPHSYETKLDMMRWFSVSSLMSTKMMTAYLDAIQRHYAGEGLVLENRDEH